MRLRLTHCVNIYCIVKLTYPPIQAMNDVHQKWWRTGFVNSCIPNISVSSIFVTLNTNAVSASLGSAWNKVLTLVWNLGMKGQSSVMIFFLSLATSQTILHALAYVMTLS